MAFLIEAQKEMNQWFHAKTREEFESSAWYDLFKEEYAEELKIPYVATRSEIQTKAANPISFESKYEKITNLKLT